MITFDRIRERVSEAYSRAIRGPSAGGCCGDPRAARVASGCCGSEATQRGTRTVGGTSKPVSGDGAGIGANVAGYSPEELASLPEEVAGCSFGCGNPLGASEIGEGDVVLDLGSGAGIDLLIAAGRVGPSGRVIGVDMTDAMIDKAEKAIAAAGVSNVEVRRGLIEELPVENASVDLVISNCVINLSPEKDRVFSEIARVLRPGGRMNISDIVVDGIPEWVRRSAGLHSACIGGAISEGSYLDGLRRAGLEDVEVTERFSYDASQLASFAVSQLPAWASSVPGIQSVLERLGRTLEGKISSVRFSARKPIPAA